MIRVPWKQHPFSPACVPPTIQRSRSPSSAVNDFRPLQMRKIAVNAPLPPPHRPPEENSKWNLQEGGKSPGFVQRLINTRDRDTTRTIESANRRKQSQQSNRSNFQRTNTTTARSHSSCPTMKTCSATCSLSAAINYAARLSTGRPGARDE